MYGIINQAIEELIRETYGDDKWELIRERSGVETDFFISHEPYDDRLTFALAGTACDVLGISMTHFLREFGEWWVLRTGREKYGGLLEAGGSTFGEFLANLPVFHNRIMLIYPKLAPPEFRVVPLGENHMQVHYHSHRHGLQEMVYGLLSGISKMYGTRARIEIAESRLAGCDHDVFNVTW